MLALWFVVKNSRRGRGQKTEPVGEEGVIALSVAFNVRIALVRCLHHGPNNEFGKVDLVHAGMLTASADDPAPWDPGEDSCVFFAQSAVHYWNLYAP